MNLFDKTCAVAAFAIGGVFLILGGLGLFMGCKANFALPPVFGVLPALVGWGIVKPIRVAWRALRRGQEVGDCIGSPSVREHPFRE